MTPHQQIALLYLKHPQLQSFDWYKSWHADHGFVFATPDYFIMGRHVCRAASQAEIAEPTRLFTKEESDCWYVHAMAGDMSAAWDMLPWELPWMAFERLREGRLELQVVELSRMRRLTKIDST